MFCASATSIGMGYKSPPPRTYCTASGQRPRLETLTAPISPKKGFYKTLGEKDSCLSVAYRKPPKIDKDTTVLHPKAHYNKQPIPFSHQISAGKKISFDRRRRFLLCASIIVIVGPVVVDPSQFVWRGFVRAGGEQVTSRREVWSVPSRKQPAFPHFSMQTSSKNQGPE